MVVVSIQSLCEFVWVLRRRYRASAGDIENSIRRLVDASHVEVDRPAVEAGLALLADGGDFADGVVAYEGERLGAETFVSFDRKAVALLAARGRKATLWLETPGGIRRLAWRPDATAQACQAGS